MERKACSSRLEFAIREWAEVHRENWNKFTELTHSSNPLHKAIGYIDKTIAWPFLVAVWTPLAIPMLMGQAEYSERERGYISKRQKYLSEEK